jgi:hypothetical protein
MPTIYLNQQADDAIGEIMAAVYKRERLSINYSQAVLKLHAAWKETKQ